MEALNDKKRIVLVLKEGKVFEGEFLKIHYRFNESKDGGFVISISKKLGKAVKRNYVKRVIRSCLRDKNTQYDLLIRPKTLNVRYNDILKDLNVFWGNVGA